jgi:hypothetical protein
MRALAVRGSLAALLAVVALLGSGCGSDGGSGSRIDWSEDALADGEIQGDALALEVPATGGRVPLAVVEEPGIGGEGYEVRGQIRYQGVPGQGFVEMWSVFADGGRYFSRTLDVTGPLAAVSGSSDWREFELPFYLNGAAPPDRLELNLVLPSGGSVQIGPLELVSLDETGTGAWWSERTGGLVGGLAGTVIGIVGATVGLLVARRRGRGIAIGAMTAAVVLGVLLLGVGTVAVAASQPYAVAYPVLLTGGILVLVFGGLLPRARRAYADHELRRMRALDKA